MLWKKEKKYDFVGAMGNKIAEDIVSLWAGASNHVTGVRIPRSGGPGINGSRALSCALLHARDWTCWVAYIVSIINLQKSQLCLLNETFNKIRARAAIDIVGPILALFIFISCHIFD